MEYVSFIFDKNIEEEVINNSVSSTFFVAISFSPQLVS